MTCFVRELSCSHKVPVVGSDRGTVLYHNLLVCRAVGRADLPVGGIDLIEMRPVFGCAKAGEDQLVMVAGSGTGKVGDLIALGLAELEDKCIFAAAAGENVLTRTAV